MKELIFHRSFVPSLRVFGSKTAVIDGDYTATYAEHADRVFRLAHALQHQLGIGRGDRFAVMAVTRHEYLELYHAAFLGAGIINPLNLRLAGKELNYILRDSGTEVVFVDQHFAPALQAALDADEPTSVRTVVLLGEGDGPCDVRYEDLLAAGEPIVPEEPEEEDSVVLMYTGGTTGLPKGVLVNQRAEILNMYHVALRFGRFNEPDEVNLLQTPIFHAASMVAILAVIPSGGTMVLMPMFEPGAVLDLIEAHGVTQTTMVPTMIGMTVSHESFRPERMASVASLTYGASPMPAVLLDKLLAMFPDMEIAQGYGMTESSSVLTFLGPKEHREGQKNLRSVGRPVMGVELSIQDEDGNLLPTGASGEVCAKGGNYMTCYWNKDDATAEAFRGGWYHTGDAGYLDEDGYLYLVDRVKDMIVSGGENIYSVEVENAIASHPAVAQVAVIGVPDETWGEAVHAIVVPKPWEEPTESEIISHARESIAGYKVPKSVDFRGEPLPLSGAMKVLKRELRAPFWEGKGKGIN